MAGLLDFLQSASNAAASNVTGPVDGIAWLLRKAGLDVGEPVGGSDWAKRKGLMRDVPQSAASLAGETAGLLGPIAAAVKAPQIASGLLQAGENLAAPRGILGPSSSQRGMAAIPTYGGSHRPVTVDGGASTLDDLVPAFGKDIYGPHAAQYYGTGDAALDKGTLRILSSLRGNPNKMVSVYRAVPANAEQTALNAGDWVTVNRAYAKMHGESTLNGNYKLIEQKVPASWLTTNADSFHEQGYYPK